MDSNKNEVINYLLDLATKQGFKYHLVRAQPHDPAICFKSIKTMFINLNWHNPNEIPFIIAHEIAHLAFGEQGVNHFILPTRGRPQRSSQRIYML